MGSKPCQDQFFHPILVHFRKIRKIQVAKWEHQKKFFLNDSPPGTWHSRVRVSPSLKGPMPISPSTWRPRSSMIKGFWGGTEKQTKNWFLTTDHTNDNITKINVKADSTVGLYEGKIELSRSLADIVCKNCSTKQLATYFKTGFNKSNCRIVIAYICRDTKYSFLYSFM